MSKLDVSSSRDSLHLSVRPEVKLKAMLEIAQNLGKTLRLEEVLQSLLDSLFTIFVQADRGFVVLASAETGALIPKAVKYRRPDAEHTARISRTIVRQAMESGKAILSADAASDVRFEMAQSIADFQIRSMMCAPLIDSESNPLGVIQIDTLDQRGRFTEDDLEVLASIASQAAVAVDNAQLHEQALRQRAMERELELAHRVQRGLVASKEPELKGFQFFHYYEAANQVGGDYFDYVPLSGGRLAVVVADVSGKGVAAALLMAKLSGEVRYHLANERDLASAVRRTNEGMIRGDWDDRFVTFFVGIIDPAEGQLKTVNAGHMAPLLRRRDGTVEVMGREAETGLPLGVAEDFPYQAAAHRLAAGELITMFTDGISEAMNAAGETYGLERLRRQIAAGAPSASSLGEMILEDVRRFVAGHPQSDDLCLACFGRQ